MIFNFAIDEVALCVVRRNFTIEALSVEEAQKLAEYNFEEQSVIIDPSPEVYLDTDKPEGYKELIYRAENGGQVLKSNA